MAVMAKYDTPEERNRKRRSTGKCKLADVVETKEPVKNDQSRDT